MLPWLIETFAGITLLFSEPPEARKPSERWRLYVFKDGEPLNGESFNPLSICQSNGSSVFYVFHLNYLSVVNVNFSSTKYAVIHVVAMKEMLENVWYTLAL